MAKKMRDMNFRKHSIDFYMDRLPIFAYSFSLEQVEYLITESVWDFFRICWAKYRSGATFA